MTKKKICFAFNTEGKNIAEQFMLSKEEQEELAEGLAEITSQPTTYGDAVEAIIGRWDGKMAAAALSTLYFRMGFEIGGGLHE